MGRWVIGAAAGRCREPRPPSCPERHGFDPNQSSGCQARATRKCEIRGHLMNFIGGEGPELVLCSELKETLKLAKPRAQEHLGVSRVAPVPFPARGRHYCGCSRDTLRPSPGLPQSCTLRGHAAPRGLQTHACRALRVLWEQLGPSLGLPGLRGVGDRGGTRTLVSVHSAPSWQESWAHFLLCLSPCGLRRSAPHKGLLVSRVRQGEAWILKGPDNKSRC